MSIKKEYVYISLKEGDIGTRFLVLNRKISEDMRVGTIAFLIREEDQA